jgi:diguanylate cyclase (GGDEF)-like protein
MTEAIVRELVITSIALGLCCFALVFFSISYRTLRDEVYLGILSICAVTALYAGLGSLLWGLAYPLRDAGLSRALMTARELSLSLFFACIPFFWSRFLAVKPRLAKAMQAASRAGLAASAAVIAAALAWPPVFISGFSFEGGSLSYSPGILYYALQAPYGAYLIGSLALLLLGKLKWGVLRLHWSFFAGTVAAVALAFSSSWRSVLGYYVDPLFFLDFPRLVVGLLSFGILVSYGFIRRFVNEAGALKATKDHLDRLLVTDSLTELPNRRAFIRDLEGMTAGGESSVLLFDLEGFNDLNESFGTKAGDEVLKGMRDLIGPALPEGTGFYRIGGDDFALILPGGKELAMGVAAAMRERLKAGIEVEGGRHQLECSIALSPYPEPGFTPEEILSITFNCLREAKRDGKGLRLFSRGYHEESLRRIDMVRRLKADIAARRFSLEYQPIHDGSGALVSAEALLRWDRGDGGGGPADFVPLLESAGLMPEMGSLIMELLLEDLGPSLRSEGFPRISVNLSAAQLSGAEAAERIAAAIEGAGARVGAFQFEVTESMFLDEGGDAVACLKRLRELGASIAIDDFGTGYSNLGYLGRLPADKIKIDKSFVEGLPGDAQAEALARSLADIGRSFRLSLLAEGVETEEQLAFLKGAGFGEFQGFIFSRPLGRDEFLRYVSAHGGGDGE